jgi:HSP90 family molecular chaperone
VKATKALEHAVERIGLHINAEKTKLMELLDMETSLDELKTLPYEKIEQFQYLSTLHNTKNDWTNEIGTRITKAERAFFALLKFFKSKLFSKRTKIRLKTSIIRQILTYGCEVWTTTNIIERRLKTFENKIWRKICGPVRDTRTGQWRRKYNQELKE